LGKKVIGGKKKKKSAGKRQGKQGFDRREKPGKGGGEERFGNEKV